MSQGAAATASDPGRTHKVNGRTIWENNKDAQCWNRDVITPFKKPFKKNEDKPRGPIPTKFSGRMYDLDGTEDGESESSDDSEGPDATGETVPSGPLGDRAILGDLGISEKELLALESGDALNEIAEILGAAEVLETVR